MSIPGFYVKSAMKLRLIPDFSGGGNMRTELASAYEFYLLSKDGRVYRNSGWGVVTARDLERFDFDAAFIDEPQNVGSYTRDDESVTIRMRDEEVAAIIVAGGGLRIGDSTYERTGFE